MLNAMSSSHDVVVIGGGPGGYAAALYGAAAGLDVAVVEKQKLGGTCLHVGCIPAKELLETASVYRTVTHADQFGIAAPSPTVDMGAAQARKQKIVDQLHKGVGKLLEGRKVTVLDGWGTLGPDRSVTVSGGESGDATLTADHVVLATGSPQCDHKDGRLDDPRLSDASLVTVDDFQPLSRGANDAKRQHCLECRDTGNRFDARRLGYSVGQVRGDGRYNGTCVGCYWHDPVFFNAEVSKNFR